MPQQVKSDREFLTTSEACEKTGLSSRYIQRLLHEGRLDGFKASSIWFVYEDSLSAFVAKPRKRGPKGAHQPKQDQSAMLPETKPAKETYPGGYTGNAAGQEVKATQ